MGETFEADRALVTAPISVLQDEDIHFEPLLPLDKRKEIMRERMPGGPKVFLRFSQRFYPDLIYVGRFLQGGVLNECGYYDAALGKKSACNVLGLFTQRAKAERDAAIVEVARDGIEPSTFRFSEGYKPINPPQPGPPCLTKRSTRPLPHHHTAPRSCTGRARDNW
mgnify:CR=1 FL=1